MWIWDEKEKKVKFKNQKELSTKHVDKWGLMWYTDSEKLQNSSYYR